VLVIASAEGVAGITAGATLLAASGLAVVTVHTKRMDPDHSRGLADLDDLRALLDEAAVAIHVGAEAVHSLRISFSQHGNSVPDEDRETVAEAGRVIVSLLSRLQVRLGLTDPIVRHFDALSVAEWNVWRETSPRDDDEARDTAKRFDAIRKASEDYDSAASRGANRRSRATRDAQHLRMPWPPSWPLSAVA
jgi:hypothetical protein